MNKIFYILFLGLILLGCVATASTVNNNTPAPAGQIIEQDVGRVNHTKSLDDFVSMGRDIENVVLMRAIKWHIEHRIIINNNSTIVFN